MTVEGHEVLIAIIGALGGIIVALAVVHKNAADNRAKDDENETSAGQLALAMAKEMKTQLDALEKKGTECQSKIAQLAGLIEKKDKRIDELEAKTEDQDRQLAILRRLSQEKDITIAELKTRLEAIEKSNGADCGEAE